MPTLVPCFLLLATAASVSAAPQLIALASKNECIKSIVYEFISSSTC